MNKELQEKIKRVAYLEKCKNKVNGYCKKIKHYIEGGHAILCHCDGCGHFAECTLSESGGKDGE